MGAEETRSKILEQTIELIKERNGDIANVTIRTIAERAGVGVGLTNHYFKTKEKLISECVDTVFRDLFAMFLNLGMPDEDEDNPIEATKKAAENVMAFMLDNEALVRAAFESEEHEPKTSDYTTRMINSFTFCMIDRKKLEKMIANDKMTERMKVQFREHLISEQKLKAFSLVATLKNAFIRREILEDTIGVDITDPDQRADYLEEVIEFLM